MRVSTTMRNYIKDTVAKKVAGRLEKAEAARREQGERDGETVKAVREYAKSLVSEMTKKVAAFAKKRGLTWLEHPYGWSGVNQDEDNTAFNAVVNDADFEETCDNDANKAPGRLKRAEVEDEPARIRGAIEKATNSVVFDLEAAVAGNLYEVDGNYKVIEDLDEWKEAEYQKKAEAFRKEHPESDFTVSQTPEVGDAPSECFDSYQEWMEDEIGTAEDVDEPDEVSLSEYLEKQGLGDTRFEVDSSKQLLGAKTLFTYGGPNIWVADDEVRGYWGNERVELCLDSDTSDALFSWFEEQWDMIKGGD